MSETYFSNKLFRFLKELEANNEREWFEENKSRYEADVREPALRFIRDFEKPLHRMSKEYIAEPKKSGGSLFRVYRDVRFSKDKSPYKTTVGIQFRHRMNKDVHAPGFYLHLEPKNNFIGVGAWHCDTSSAHQIRRAIVDDSSGWKKAVHSNNFRSKFEMFGESLKRPPRGFDKEHPLIEDLKRKEFIAVHNLSQKEVTSDDVIANVESAFRDGMPLVRFLCKALDLPF